MRKLIRCANQFIWESDWKFISLLKFCLLSLGLCIGLRIPNPKKKTVFTIAAITFMVSYIPLMARFVQILCADEE